MGKKQLLIFGVVIAVGIGLIWGIVSFLHGFSEYKQSILTPPTSEISVKIVAPTGDDPGLVGSPVVIMAYASGSLPLESIIFWINGVPVSVQAAAGEDPLAGYVSYFWIPTEAGSYTIFVRGQAENGVAADSDLLIFEVLPGSKPVDPEPLTPDPAYAAPPTSSGDTGSASGWAGSVGGWISPPEADSLPDAPGLTASVNGCEAALSIYDNSNNEAGFRIYRSLPNIPGWSLVDTLAPNDTLSVLNYSASGYYGSIGYKASAFNSQGEAVSSPVVVEVDPEDCPADDLPIVSLQMVNLEPLVPLDLLYCYFSIDGTDWMRWPQNGFIPASGDGFDLTQTDLFSMLEGSQLEMLQMDCWGWQGGELVDLGQFGIDQFGDGNLEPIAFGNQFIQGALEFGPVNTMEGTQFEGDYSLFLPVPVLSDSTSFGECEAKSSDDANLPLRYCLEADGESDWPYTPVYITWDIVNNCAASPNCIDFLDPDALTVPELSGAEIGYRVYSWNSGLLVRTFSTPNQMVYAVPGVMGNPNNCDQRIGTFLVSSYLIPQGSQQIFESPTDLIEVTMPCPQIDGARIRVTPETLTIVPGPEEQGEGSLLDLYGYVYILTDYLPDNFSVLQFGSFGSEIKGGCRLPDSVDELGGAAFHGKCPITNGWGVDFTQAYICPDVGLDGCKSSFSLGTNETELSIVEGQTLTIQIEVADYDLNSADDPVCSGTLVIPAWEADGWQTMIDGLDLVVVGDGPYGACFLQFSVEELYQFSND